MGDAFDSDDCDRDNASGNSSPLQTGRAGKNTYRMYQENTHNRNTRKKDHRAKPRLCRDPSPDEGAPIYPLNPDDPEPECNNAEYGQSGRYRDHHLLYLVAGYIVGILLVLIWYHVNPERVSSDLGGTWFFIVLIFLLLLILAQRRPARCIALLCFPTLAHYQSQAAIVALAFLIAFSGPVMNIIQNIFIMAYSLNCGHSQLQGALRKFSRIIGDPSHSMEESFQGTFNEVRWMLAKLDKLFVKLENPIARIHATYRTSASWLALQNEHFDYRMASPHTRCLRAGTLSIRHCQSEFGERAKECCNQELFAWFCGSLKGVKSFFDNDLLLPQIVIEDTFRHLQLCFLKIRSMFIATISFDHSAKLNTSLVATGPDLIYDQDMNKHLEAARHKIYNLSFWLHFIFILLLLAVILRAINFHVCYLMSEHFDNVYITEQFEVYDELQSQIMGVRVLPLNSCEEIKYVKITSLRLLPGELKAMYRSGFFLVITGIQLFCICYVDYSLYSMLALMSHHGNMTTDFQPFPYRKLFVTGGGRIGDILRDLVHAFEPKTFQVDSYNCLPLPGKPKSFQYFWISVLYVLAWTMVLWEPYGLRQRHRIMSHFYPEESNRRVEYLHYTILKERKSVLELRRQRARCLHFYRYNSRVLSCISRLGLLSSWCFSGCRGALIDRSCTICSKPLTKSDCVFCDLPNCAGAYCNVCFCEFNNSCILCNSPPSECGLSELGDSSDDWDYSYCSPDNIQSP